MPAPKRKPKAPLLQLDKTTVAGQPTITETATPAPASPDPAPVAPSPSAAAVPPLNYEQLRRLRSKLKQKYHA